jgi:hypothetical protein
MLFVENPMIVVDARVFVSLIEDIERNGEMTWGGIRHRVRWE